MEGAQTAGPTNNKNGGSLNSRVDAVSQDFDGLKGEPSYLEWDPPTGCTGSRELYALVQRYLPNTVSTLAVGSKKLTVP